MRFQESLYFEGHLYPDLRLASKIQGMLINLVA